MDKSDGQNVEVVFTLAMKNVPLRRLLIIYHQGLVECFVVVVV